MQDAAVPPAIVPPSGIVEGAGGVVFSSATWTPPLAAALAEHLESRGGKTLASLDDETILLAWSATVSAFRDPGSRERRGVHEPLARLTGLSAQALDAALEAVLGGVSESHARRLFGRVATRRGSGLLVVVLAANIPALAVQPLLPALALRRPVLLKSATTEPLFAPAFLRALTARCPGLAHALAAIRWRGGDRGVEEPLFDRARTVVAYGGGQALESIARRVPAARFLDYGPRVSLAVVGTGVAPEHVARGLARDIALFDQKGCLSVQMVYTAGEAGALAAALAQELRVLARHWPPGEPDPVAASRVHQLRAEAQMRGLRVEPLTLRQGTVIVEPRPTPSLSPGLRSVRIHPLPRLSRLPAVLAPLASRLQGVALAGEDAWNLLPELESLGVSRAAAPGRLQTPDAAWQNGGRDLLEELADGPGSTTDGLRLP